MFDDIHKHAVHSLRSMLKDGMAKRLGALGGHTADSMAPEPEKAGMVEIHAVKLHPPADGAHGSEEEGIPPSRGAPSKDQAGADEENEKGGELEEHKKAAPTLHSRAMKQLDQILRSKKRSE